MWNWGFVRNRTRKAVRRLAMASVAAALLFSLPGAGASETVSNRFDLFVPVSLSVLEISSSVLIVPFPLVACKVVRFESISNAVQEVVR